MVYQCTLTRGKRREKWAGEIQLLSWSGSRCEAEITGRETYFHLIAGKHRYGNYLCIPNHDVGSELSSYKDVFWNTERLSRRMDKADAVTVAYGLSHLEELAAPGGTSDI